MFQCIGLFRRAWACAVNPPLCRPSGQPGKSTKIAAKSESDRYPGPICGMGPVGLQHLTNQLGLDFGMATLADVAKEKQLPKPFRV